MQYIFNRMHNELQNEIINVAWNCEAELDFAPLFPRCRNRYAQYCEGKPWKPTFAYCPRTKKPCKLNSAPDDFSQNYFSEGARIVPNCNLDWSQWSLLEFFKYKNIIPKLPELSNSDEYTNRMAGWLNRLIEIRERLKCRVCGKPLVSYMKYSKNLACYSSTVFYCPEGHDNRIYISHCWNCHKVIDSRDCHEKDSNGYYICTKCGRGSKDSSQKEELINIFDYQ